QRFLAPEREHPEHCETVVEQREDSRLERFVEVDQHVAAENYVEFTERSVSHEIMLREHDILREIGSKQRSVVFRSVVIRERTLAAGRDVILGVLLHSI